MVFFRLHESPRFLVHAGRPEDAIKSLQMISRFNGSDLSIELEDVADHYPSVSDSVLEPSVTRKQDDVRPRANSSTILDANFIEDRPEPPSRNSSTESTGSGRTPLVTLYASTGETQILDNYTFATPVMEAAPVSIAVERATQMKEEPSILPISPSIISTSPALQRESSRRNLQTRRLSMVSRKSSICEKKASSFVPDWLSSPLWAWWDRVTMVLSPEWLRTTVLMWSAWFTMSLGKKFVISLKLLLIMCLFSIHHV